MSTCQVCLNPFNKSTRLRVECPTCSIEFCRGCLQSYALTQLSEPFRCIAAPEAATGCTAMWDREFLDAHTTATFRLHEYKAHREKILCDREKSRLPATQEDAIAFRDARTLMTETKEDLSALREQLYELNRKIYQAERRSVLARDILVSVGRLRMPIENVLTWESAAVAPGFASAASAKKVERAAFIKPCPGPECKGFLSSAWKCGMCETWSCPECHDWKGDSKEKDGSLHTCDAGKVATARMIDREAKSCPKCGISICKIEGCDQMFCTGCNTGFNWRTGKVAEGPVHNPHYFEWLRRTGAVAATGGAAAPIDAAALCGFELDRQIALSLNNRGYQYRNPSGVKPTLDDNFLMEAWRIMREEEAAENAEETVEEIFRKLRVRYLCDEFTKEAWPVALQRAEKNAAVRQAKADLRMVYTEGVRDIIRQVLAPGADKKKIRHQVEELVAYCNKCRDETSMRFNRTVKHLEIREVSRFH